LSGIASVASFFVSRVDTEADRRLESIAATAGDGPRAEQALALRGKLAVAQARLAYEIFAERFSGPRWEALAHAGARPQRPLWASTSTKNPAYPDLVYVDGLIGPQTVNTMPEATVDAFLDHGIVARTVDADLQADHAVVSQCLELGLDPAEVSAVLEDEGVASFAKSFDELVDSLEQKAAALGVTQ
jgi:transaldolase